MKNRDKKKGREGKRRKAGKCYVESFYVIWMLGNLMVFTVNKHGNSDHLNWSENLEITDIK